MTEDEIESFAAVDTTALQTFVARWVQTLKNRISPCFLELPFSGISGNLDISGNLVREKAQSQGKVGEFV